jgi:UDP:flavonoid glycosyltransferase YjiC (YdhE family)
MPEASVVVGHGGHSTTFAALAHDLPLVVMPMHPMLDQPMVGRAVARAGAAIVLPRTATPAAIAKAVGSLLAPSAARDAAAHIGARIRATDAAGAGADRLELLAAANRVPGP